MVEENTITSVQDLIEATNEVLVNWNTGNRAWFRGEPSSVATPLLPKLYRENHNELQLLKHFRMKAPTYVDIQIPQRGHTDQWLFLAQHSGLPTRLLDFTEGLLIALHFAVYSHERGAVVWMLNPVALNEMSVGRKMPENDYPITWFSPELDPLIWLQNLLNPDVRAHGVAMDFSAHLSSQIANFRPRYNIGNLNVRAAWEANPALATELPVAIHPTSIHPRLTVQKSTFLIWGNRTIGLAELVDSHLLRKFLIEDEAINSIKAQLDLFGITKATLFPDLDSLASDLGRQF